MPRDCSDAKVECINAAHVTVVREFGKKTRYSSFYIFSYYSEFRYIKIFLTTIPFAHPSPFIISYWLYR